MFCRTKQLRDRNCKDLIGRWFRYLAKNPLRNFISKNCLFGGTNIVKSNDKSKYVYSGRGIGFDGLGSWSFANDFAWNVVNFGVDIATYW